MKLDYTFTSCFEINTLNVVPLKILYVLLAWHHMSRSFYTITRPPGYPTNAEYEIK